MGDFFQNGTIATLHNLSNRPVVELESDLSRWAERRPMSLIIPSLASELDGDGLPAIVEVLRGVSYIDEVIIGLDKADEAQFQRARTFFAALPMRHRILWNDGPRLREVQGELESRALASSDMGKGRNVWYSLGYFLASGRGSIVAMHDADVLTYSRELIARLYYPLANPTFGYVFCKGYYFRSDGERMNGRVSRVLITPLVRALRQTIGPSDYLDYIDSFRYPLAGECAMEVDVARTLRIPFDWGLEIGVLSEIYRNYTVRRICQVDLADAYDHKHQEVSVDDPDHGLHRVAIDIVKAFLTKLALLGEVLSPAALRTLKATFHQHALELMQQYHHDAELNGYAIDRVADEQLVDVFSRAIMTAGDHYLAQPVEAPFMPSWSVVLETVPDVFDRLVGAVEADNSV